MCTLTLQDSPPHLNADQWPPATIRYVLLEQPLPIHPPRLGHILRLRRPGPSGSPLPWRTVAYVIDRQGARSHEWWLAKALPFLQSAAVRDPTAGYTEAPDL